MLAVRIIFNDDYRLQNNRKYHPDMLFQNKCIAYEQAYAPLNLFEAANEIRTNHATSEQPKVSGSPPNKFVENLSPDRPDFTSVEMVENLPLKGPGLCGGRNCRPAFAVPRSYERVHGGSLSGKGFHFCDERNS